MKLGGVALFARPAYRQGCLPERRERRSDWPLAPTSRS